MSCVSPQPQYIGGPEIGLCSGYTTPFMFQYDYLYSAATCIDDAVVLLAGGLISYDCTMSAWHLKVEIKLHV
jgi:hypothetical protein